MIDWMWIVMGVPIFILAGSVHEFMHAWTASKLGDPTAANNGRLTVNPLAHVDPFGILLMVFAHFGWMKPVPIREDYFKKPVRDMALVAVAGPVSNILMAFIGSLVLKGLLLFTSYGSYDAYLSATVPFPIMFLYLFIWVNAALAVFNVIPIPPLDGYRVVRAFLPTKLRIYWEYLENYSWIVLLLLFLPFSPLSTLVGNLISTGIEALVTILL